VEITVWRRKIKKRWPKTCPESIHEVTGANYHLSAEESVPDSLPAFIGNIGVMVEIFKICGLCNNKRNASSTVFQASLLAAAASTWGQWKAPHSRRGPLSRLVMGNNFISTSTDAVRLQVPEFNTTEGRTARNSLISTIQQVSN
jgi:hypothetical protein